PERALVTQGERLTVLADLPPGDHSSRVTARQQEQECQHQEPREARHGGVPIGHEEPPGERVQVTARRGPCALVKGCKSTLLLPRLSISSKRGFEDLCRTTTGPDDTVHRLGHGARDRIRRVGRGGL